MLQFDRCCVAGAAPPPIPMPSVYITASSANKTDRHRLNMQMCACEHKANLLCSAITKYQYTMAKGAHSRHRMFSHQNVYVGVTFGWFVCATTPWPITKIPKNKVAYYILSPCQVPIDQFCLCLTVSAHRTC